MWKTRPSKRRDIDWEWLTGPIFAKELRISSRRRRNYGLRFAYLSLLILFVFFMLRDARLGGRAGSQVYRLAEVGRQIALAIVHLLAGWGLIVLCERRMRGGIFGR